AGDRSDRAGRAHPMQRLITAAVGVPLALAATFLLPGPWFFLLFAILIDWAAFEYLAIVRPRAPHAPLSVLLVLVPLAAVGLAVAFLPGRGIDPLELLIALAVLSVGIGT